MKTLGERLKFVMDLRGENQLTLAKKINVAQNTISKVITGGSKGTVHLVQLSKVLQCDPFWLGMGTGHAPDSGIPAGKTPIITWQELIDIYKGASFKAQENQQYIDVPAAIDECLYALKIGQHNIEPLGDAAHKLTILFSTNDILFIDIKPAHTKIQNGDYLIVGEDQWYAPLVMKYVHSKNKKNLITINECSNEDPIQLDDKIHIYAKIKYRLNIF